MRVAKWAPFILGCAAALLTIVVVVSVLGPRDTERTGSFWLCWMQVGGVIAGVFAAFSKFRPDTPVKSLKLNTILKNVPCLLVLATFAIIEGYVFVNLPPPVAFKLRLRQASVQSLELSMASTQRVVTASDACADVLKTIQTARVGEMHPSGVLGRLTVHYSDRTNVVIVLLPSHDLNRVDLVGNGIVYTIAKSEIFGVSAGTQNRPGRGR